MVIAGLTVAFYFTRDVETYAKLHPLLLCSVFLTMAIFPAAWATVFILACQLAASRVCALAPPFGSGMLVQVGYPAIQL